jgi:HEPN domain-containing protein
MPKADFDVDGLSTRGAISFDVDKIYGAGGPEYPCLSIPAEFTLIPGEREGKIKAYSLLWLKSSLYVGDKKFGEGVSEAIAEYSWPHLSARQVAIEIPLDLYRIDKIEERRRGDIQLRLSGSALIAEHPPITQIGPNERQEYKKDVEEFTRGRFNISFSIPHSLWVDKILPHLGYGKVKLIEVPIPEKIVPDTFQKALKELQEAQRYFVEGDYDKVVAHCRSAVQLIPESLKTDLSGIEKPSFNDKTKKFLDEFSSFLNDSKREALETIIKATWRLSSVPHHPSPSGYFNRADAEAIYQVTTTLIAYVGKLLKQREES